MKYQTTAKATLDLMQMVMVVKGENIKPITREKALKIVME